MTHLFIVTYDKVGRVVNSPKDAAELMIDLWTTNGPQDDIRTDRWRQGQKEPITRRERAEIEAHIRAIAFIGGPT